MSQSMVEALQTFIAESEDLLRELEGGLLACVQRVPDADTISQVFRAAHTLKGSAGLFGLDAVVTFVHGVETALDRVRRGQLEMDTRLVTLLLKCKDHIEALIEPVAAEASSPDPQLAAHGAALLEELQGVAGGICRVASVTPKTAPLLTSPVEANRTPTGDTVGWHVSVRFGPEVLKAGMDPLGILRYLSSLGTITGVVWIEDSLPKAADFDPEVCYLGLEMGLRSDLGRERIEGAFEFVREDCTLALLPPGTDRATYVQFLHRLGLNRELLCRVLSQCAALTPEEIDSALAAAEARTADVADHVAPSSSGHSANGTLLTQERKAQGARPPDQRSIRIDADKLDLLITSIGELIIASAGSQQLARRGTHPALAESTSVVATLVEQIRERALQLRMIKIASTFNRFHRVVNDVSRELGKEIVLTVSGEETELDKTVIERIADPLTHLVRNAMDHGIEPVEVRTARGKPAAGTVGLHAYHDSGSIVIEVTDDGGGLSRERIVAKAVERGLIEPGCSLSDAEIFELIFAPGFSTAEHVTSLSGRGVGMDVVKKNITALRGVVQIASTEGHGCRVTVRLPLTLAIINGFQIGVGRSVFVLPLDAVEECVEFSADCGHDYTSLRGEVLPFIELRDLFGIAEPAGRRPSIVIVRYAGRRAGLVVDTLLGESQTVIKPLGKMFQSLECVSGSSILGTGEVALILDIPAVVQRAIDRATVSLQLKNSPSQAAMA